MCITHGHTHARAYFHRHRLWTIFSTLMKSTGLPILGFLCFGQTFKTFSHIAEWWMRGSVGVWATTVIICLNAIQVWKLFWWIFFFLLRRFCFLKLFSSTEKHSSLQIIEIGSFFDSNNLLLFLSLSLSFFLSLSLSFSLFLSLSLSFSLDDCFPWITIDKSCRQIWTRHLIRFYPKTISGIYLVSCRV